MSSPIYTLRRVHVAAGGKTILDDVTVAFPKGGKVGVVGKNGAGKSTLLNVMAGLARPTAGDATPSPGTSIGILDQEPPLDDRTTVAGNVEQAVSDIRTQLAHYDQVAQSLAEASDTDTPRLLAELGRLQERLDHLGAWDLEARVAQAMDALRCPPPDTPVLDLSGGQRRRVALCRLLLAQPDLLLLDEPTTHLDAESVHWLEQHLLAYRGTVVAVTHDRYFLDHVAEQILEVERGHLYRYDGNYTAYLTSKATRMTVDGAKDTKLRERLVQELDWARTTADARHHSARVRLASYERLAARAEHTNRGEGEDIRIPPGPRLGSLVVEADRVTKGYRGRLLIGDLSFVLPRAGIVGVLGPNGVGKTTLFRLMVGDEKPDAGRLRLGDTVVVSYVDQTRSGLESQSTVWEAVSGGQDVLQLAGTEIPSRGYVASFGFKGADQQKPVGLLSGGERNRLNLALTLKRGGNLLLLDEPTNDLDVDTLVALERALLNFPGCAVIATHDRWFIDRVATHILAWEGGASWVFFEGNFADYHANKLRRLGTGVTRPEHTLHRRLARG